MVQAGVGGEHRFGKFHISRCFIRATKHAVAPDSRFALRFAARLRERVNRTVSLPGVFSRLLVFEKLSLPAQVCRSQRPVLSMLRGVSIFLK